MFSIFKSKGQDDSQPDWLSELQDSEQRFFAFLEKLEAKMQELCEAAIPELKDLFNNDDDVHRMTFYRMQSGIMGQLDNIRKKAYEVNEDKILNLYYNINSEVSVSSPHYKLLNEFRTRCSDRYHKVFDENCNYWREQIDSTSEEDFEKKYQLILTEYESIKNGFTCKQCGSGLTIEKIFFISTFITCPSCQTQNTFEPSSQARSLQFLAPNLADQRVAHLLEAYNYQIALERELYFKKHDMHLSATFEKDNKIKVEKEQKEKEFEALRQEAIKKAPELYFSYLRAKYDEIHKIIPDLIEHNEVRYQNEYDSYSSKFS
jgi:hypothetical protein